MATLRNWVISQQFNPGVLGAFVNPFFLARRALWREISTAAPALKGRLLDVGCGRKPYRTLFDVDEYIGLEIESAETRARGVADVFYGGSEFPFPSESFDVVLCNQVLEHVFTPFEFLSEINRVLRPGGTLLLTVPFVWDEHEQPNDFARYTSFGLGHLLENTGFLLAAYAKTLEDFSIICQLINAYLHKRLWSNSTIANAVVSLLLMAPVSLGGLVLGQVLPKNPDLFLDSVVVARKK